HRRRTSIPQPGPGRAAAARSPAARARAAAKRGRRRKRAPLGEAARWAESPDQLSALNDALDLLAPEEPRKAELVTLRFFAGMSTPEAAAGPGVSAPTAERWRAFARTWLLADLDGETRSRPLASGRRTSPSRRR